MEKLIYALWRDEAEPRVAFNDRLLGAVAAELAPHTRALRINVQDESVATGSSPHFIVTQPQMEAMVQMWVDTAYPPARAPIEKALARVAPRYEGWLVSESIPLPNSACPPGLPTDGFAQVVFIEKPAALDHETWRRNWQDGHTDVAVETQSNFEYVQNLVVRPLTEGAGPYAAVVEECFPLAARTDKALFYDAVGDAARLEANEARMMASCANFIGEKGCDCIPMRQYQIKQFA
ncbi:hypothetical protein FHS96_001780 [Sphingomonas zeicaulis]|uniref:EthD domain-containing protein n=1 Tax=Sphingomonas zeicaulis TaxID=1632740 RepID=UPI003D1C3C1D